MRIFGPRSAAKAAPFAALIAMAASGPAPSMCDGMGCFAATTTGHVTQTVSGKSWYHLDSGSLRIVLLENKSNGLSITISRDSAGIPAQGSEAVVVAASCNANDDGSEDAEADAFRVSVRGGAIRPAWLATPTSGTLRLVTSTGGALTGTFELEACGTEIKTENEVEIKIEGSFRAVKL